MNAERFVLTLSCPDQPGIVAAISSKLFEMGANILDSQQFNDHEHGSFFMRISFVCADATLTTQAIHDSLSDIAKTFDMRINLRHSSERQRVLILASKFDHCLTDLIYRWRTGELPMDIVGIVSNHPRETYSQADLAGLEFHYLKITKDTKVEQEAALWDLIQTTRTDLVVLARYMQILSDDLARKLDGRCINIHHSFLPSFKGAKPYHQAHERGVKLIGATAHYVTGDLDEGPIIEQDVERIYHDDSAEDLVRKGRDIERRVLARAVSWHLRSRVLLDGHKSIVFGH